jgi:hypothetical protein
MHHIKYFARMALSLHSPCCEHMAPTLQPQCCTNTSAVTLRSQCFAHTAAATTLQPQRYVTALRHAHDLLLHVPLQVTLAVSLQVIRMQRAVSLCARGMEHVFMAQPM